MPNKQLASAVSAKYRSVGDASTSAANAAFTYVVTAKSSAKVVSRFSAKSQSASVNVNQATDFD